MRALTRILVIHVVAVTLGALWRILPFETVAPQIAVAFAAYLGIGRDRLPAATATVIVAGYLADVASGAPGGLNALVAGAVCVLARGASGRLLVRGRLFVAIFAAVSSLVATVLLALVRVIHGLRFSDPLGELVVAAGVALLTALLAPPLFRLLRSIDAAFARTGRDREAIREGYLS